MKTESSVSVLKKETQLIFKKLLSKKCFFILFFFLLLLNIMLSSCDNDGYSLGDIYWDYGVIQKEGEGYTVRLDNGAVLFPSASAVPAYYLKDKDRLIVDYTILGDAAAGSYFDYYVKINDVYKILTKDILEYTPLISDSLGHDPVILNEVWIKNGYINFDFFYSGGQPGVIHMVNLAKHPEKTEDGRILLDFRHNANDDLYSYKYRGIVAFPASQIYDVWTDSVCLRLRYDGYGREETEDITWYMKENETNRRIVPKTESPLKMKELVK